MPRPYPLFFIRCYVTVLSSSTIVRHVHIITGTERIFKLNGQRLQTAGKMPSACEDRYYHDYDELVNKGSPSPSGGRRGPHSKVLYDGPACLSKTLHDPSNTLSKRERKRLLRDVSDGLCPGVEYSLNKHNRWEMIERLVPEWFVVRKFDARRISIANQANAFPEFVMFFEADEARQQLRIRLNASARYRELAGRTALHHLLNSCSDFEALFSKLVDFVLQLDPIMPSRPKNARYEAFRESFGKKVNSRRMSVMMSFSFYHSLAGKEPFFTQCPECSLRLVVKNTEDATEQFLLDDDSEQVLRLTCACEHSFYVLESEAQGARCPNSRCAAYRYDTSGLLRDKWDFFLPYSARDRKRCINEEGKMAKRGTPVHPEIVSPVRSIRKEFAEVCARSRNMRFSKEKMTAFANSVSKGFSCESRQKQAVDARRTVLLLIEHVTAWLYLHRDRGIDVRPLMVTTSKLFEQLLAFEEHVLDEKENLDKCVDTIDEEADKLMMLVRRAMQKDQS
ncbi:unnamed protein product [Heligmosomoides polygyrus]|uniref:SET domain-containing protein n=1 Tax=Heligmosomoides polygyrus TaxID=6339 RepID=A0A3P7YGG0_HELPZ|nr:unnamed protein product [Heligmosomoides polygyrus]